MEEKIYEKVKEKHCRITTQYMRTLGIIGENDEIKTGPPKKNIDLWTILSKLGLIEITDETCEIIDNFHDDLFKLGIHFGVNYGKRMIIEAIQEDPAGFDAIMGIDPEEYVSYNVEPPFIDGLREAIMDEK